MFQPLLKVSSSRNLKQGGDLIIPKQFRNLNCTLFFCILLKVYDFLTASLFTQKCVSKHWQQTQWQSWWLFETGVESNQVHLLTYFISVQFKASSVFTGGYFLYVTVLRCKSIWQVLVVVILKISTLSNLTVKKLFSTFTAVLCVCKLLAVSPQEDWSSKLLRWVFLNEPFQCQDPTFHKKQ